jgi:hypothetical protein
MHDGLAEICRERGVSGEVFDLPFLEAVMEWCRRTGGRIPDLIQPPRPIAADEGLRPATAQERTAISRHWSA